MKKLLLALAGGALLIGGCAIPSTSPAPTVTVTTAPSKDPYTPAPYTPRPYTPKPATPTPDEDRFNLTALELAWESFDSDEQEAMCRTYNYDADGTWESFISSGNDTGLTRSTFDTFFSSKC